MGLSLSGKTKPFCFGGRNALENVAQERSWFCPAIERALGLLPSIALSSHPTDLIVGSGRRKSIGLRLKTDCRRSTLNSLIFGLDTGEYLRGLPAHRARAYCRDNYYNLGFVSHGKERRYEHTQQTEVKWCLIHIPDSVLGSFRAGAKPLAAEPLSPGGSAEISGSSSTAGRRHDAAAPLLERDRFESPCPRSRAPGPAAPGSRGAAQNRPRVCHRAHRNV